MVTRTKKPFSMFNRLLVTLLLIDVFFVVMNLITQSYGPSHKVLLLAWGAAQLMFLFAVTLWTSYFLVAKPLMSFIRSIQSLEIEDFSVKNKIINSGVQDSLEINLLINSFNNILDNLYNAKSNLLSMQERLIGIINSMPSVIIGVDEAGSITDWNAQAIEVTKLSATEAKGKILTDLYPDYTDYWLLAKMAMVKNHMQKHTKHLREVAKENKYFDIIAYPVVNNNYKGAVIRIDEVTAQVLLEDIMAQTEKMNSLGGLAAGVAHEINNPLGSIVQSGQNILRRLDPSIPKNLELAKRLNLDINAMYNYVQENRILEFIHGIRDAGNRAANIVANLLQFARTSNAQKAMHSINKIVDTAIELASADYNIQKKTDFRHIKIIKDYDGNLPSVYCCAMEIEQVILNILKNAAYALTMVTRSPVIHIKIWGEQDMLIIEIQDNGLGMKEEVKKKIFDPFFTTKPVGEGTGLGLSVSFNIIVDRHGGSFAVESTEGLGTKFIIVLPLISLSKENLKDYMQTMDFA